MSSSSSSSLSSIHVYVAPYEYDQIVSAIKKFSAASSSTTKLSIEEHFESFINTTILTNDNPASFLFHSKKSRTEIFPLLLKISEAMPELFEFNIVTKRLLQIINKMCIVVPPKPKEKKLRHDDNDNDDDEEEEDYDETMIDNCASIISNTSGDISRNHADQIFRFSSHQEKEQEQQILAEFKMTYGPSFVTVITASILWPGATAFSSLLIQAAKLFHRSSSSDEMNCRHLNPCHELLYELYQNCFTVSSCARGEKEILEIGCGLGLLSTALASQLHRCCFVSSQQQQEKKKQKLILKTTDLFESAAKNASENVKRVLTTTKQNHNNSCSENHDDDESVDVEVAYASLNWKEFSSTTDDPTTTSRERIIIGSEVFFDEEMSHDVANFFGTRIENWKVGYLLLLERRPGFDNFPTYCEEFGLSCEVFSFEKFFKNDFRITTEVEIGTGENAIGKANLEDWALIRIKRKEK